MQKNKVRTAVVGAGKMGAIHAKVYDQLEQSDFIAIVDTDTDKARKLADQYNCSMFSDYSDILGNVDAVTIATPTISHLNLAAKFIENNIAVLIEKPLATNVTEGKKIADLAKKHNIVAAVGHSERCNPVVQAIKRLDIKPKFIECNRVSPYPFRSTDVGVVLESPALSQPLLAILVAVATFLIFGFALLTAIPEPPGDDDVPVEALADGETGGRLVKLPVVHNKATLLVDPDDVVCIRAEAHYTTVFTANGGYFCALSLSALEGRLDPDTFLRVHRSHIVNMRHATAFERLNEQAVIVVGEPDASRRIPVSRGKIRQLKTALGV